MGRMEEEEGRMEAGKLGGLQVRKVCKLGLTLQL